MEEVIKYLKSKIDQKEYVVVAVSGGPDSMALLDVITKVTDKIVCAHVNHKIRKESDDEYVMVKNYCSSKNVIFEGICINNYTNENFHKQARKFRYNFFETILKKYNSKYLITAHHGDDLLETILMRLVRGSTLKGYSGFPKELVLDKYTILRPFINLSKVDLIMYDKNNKINYAIDESNFKDVYTRNRFRKLLPYLKAENPNLLAKINEFSNTLLECNNFIYKEALTLKKKVYHNNRLLLQKFNKQDEIIKKAIIKLILKEKYKEQIELVSNKNVNDILKMSKSSKSNMQLFLPNNLLVNKSYDIIIFEPQEQEQGYRIELKSKVILENGKTIEIVDKYKKDSNYICRLNKKDIVLPLYVRTKQNGDKIEVKNLNGHQKIKDIFIDSKIPLSERKKWPIVVDSNDLIVWLPGLKKSVLDKQEEDKYDIILKYY